MSARRQEAPPLPARLPYLSGGVIVRGRLGLRIERDLHFRARKPLSAYACDAHRAGMIVTG